MTPTHPDIHLSRRKALEHLNKVLLTLKISTGENTSETSSYELDKSGGYGKEEAGKL